jgi:Protein of unknown function (DUF2510)
MAITADIAHRIPAGWYPCREDRSRRRWWDGTEWTDYYSAAPTRPLSIVESLADAPSTAHSLRAAVTFRDRIAAFTLAGIILANLVVIAFLTHLV